MMGCLPFVRLERLLAAEQNYGNHARLDPPLHFFVAPELVMNVLVTRVVLIDHWPHAVWLHAWLCVLAVALLVLAAVTRSSALRAQDRVIRLEEALRYQRLLSPVELAAAQGLTLRQVIALRFASDAELPALVQRALAERMTAKAIKQAITVWRPDLHRV